MEMLVVIPITFLMLVVLTVALRLVYGLQLKRETIWGEVAARHGLRLDLAPAAMERRRGGFGVLLSMQDRVEREVVGRLEEVEIALRLLVVGTVSNNQARQIEGEARLAVSLPEGAEVASRGLLSSGGTPTGDAAFDQAFRVSGLGAAQQAALLTPAARGALLSLYRMTGSVELKGDRLLCHKRGQISDAKRLEALLLSTVKAARALNGGLTDVYLPAKADVFLPARAQEAAVAEVAEAVEAEARR
jgi:hypothetical protein